VISPTRAVSGLWLAWLLGWLLAARATARTVVRQSVTSRLAHSVLIWGGALLLFVQSDRWGILTHPIIPASTWIIWSGVVLVALGLGFSAWARAHLGRFWSGTVTFKADHALIRTGPYGVTRHPIYTGLLLALAGTALVRCTPAALVGLVLMVLGFVLKIRQEEQLLSEHFGSEYGVYQAEVPALVPGLRSRGSGRRF
jgi:protein-S-isoprenylcysteine O-methyltransferase Ste14